MKIENTNNRSFFAQMSTALLKKIIKLAGGIETNKMKLCFGSTSTTIVLVDDALVATTNIVLQKTAFEKYETDEFEVGIYLERLKQIVNLTRTDDVFTMRFDNKNSQFVFDFNNIRTRMGILDPSEIPEVQTSFLSQSGHIVLPVEQLKRGIAAADYVSDTVLLSIDPEKFELKCEKNMDSVHLTLSKNELIEHASELHHRKSFSTHYLSSIIGCLNDGHCIRLRFGSDTHLQLDYDFSDGNGHLTFVLMPQVES